MVKELYQLFKTLENQFPYSTMSETFKGHHHLILDREGRLMLNVWSNGRLYNYGLAGEDLTDLPKLVSEIKADLEQKNKIRKNFEKVVDKNVGV